MAAFSPIVRAVAYETYINLQDMAVPGSYKANPTIAAGDFQISKDGGAFANMATLPTVVPAAGRAVKMPFSGTEMTADNVVVQCVDQSAPKEWADYSWTIQTVDAKWLTEAQAAAAVWDALLTGISTAGSIGKLIEDNLDVVLSTRLATAGYTAPDNAGIAAIKVKTDQLIFTIANKVDSSIQAAGDFAQAAADKVWATAARILTAATNITSTGGTSTGGTTVPQTGDSFARLGAPAGASVSADIAAIEAQTDDIGVAGAGLTAITAKTDNLPSDPADASDIASAFGTVNATLATIAAFVDTEVSAIKAKTDQLTFTVANKLDVTIQAAGNIAAAVLNEIADSIFTRASTFWEAAAPKKSLGSAVMKATHRTRNNAGTLEVYLADGTTVHASQTITTDAAADPIDELTGAA